MTSPAPLALAVGLVLAPVAYATPRATLEFDPGRVHLLHGSAGARVTATGLEEMAAPDAPPLPVTIRTFLVPEGWEVAEVRAHRRGEVLIERGVRLAPRAERVEPDERVPGFPTEALAPGAAFHPSTTAAALATGTLAGHRLQAVAVFPVRQERATGDLTLATAIDVELALRPARDGPGLRRLRSSPTAEAEISRSLRTLVANPEDVPAAEVGPHASDGGFAPRDLPSVEGSAVDMVIVTTDALEPSLRPLAEWKTRKGVPTVIRTVEWIEANYPAGHDQPERVRHFLQDAYAKWGTFLVLLGGDYDDVRPRNAYNRFFFGGAEVPTDQYFACLEGDWNANGNDLIGEGTYFAITGDEVDLYPDLFVGRAPVADPAEAAAFVSKSIAYETTPDPDYVESVCHMAEVLFPQDWEFGIDPPESISYSGEAISETFDAEIDPAWTRTLCYQSQDAMSRPRVLSELSAGHHLITLVTHGDAFKFSAGNGPNPLVFISDIAALTNQNRYQVVYAIACNPNQFDLESLGESYLNNPDGGAIAVIGPTRVDFPSSGQGYFTEMLRLVFGHGVTRFGSSVQMCRVPYVPFSQSDVTADRWTMLSKNLFGDPELRMWTRSPENLVVTHAFSIPLDAGDLVVTVTEEDLTPVADALVCVSDGAGTYSRGRTDATGIAVLPLRSSATGAADVLVTKAEFLPHEGTVTLHPVAGPHLSLASFAPDDGTGPGNADGHLDAGETAGLSFEVANGGGADAADVTVTASVEPGSQATFDILVDGVRDPALVFVGPARENPAGVPFTLDFADPLLEYTGRPSFTFSPDSSGYADSGVFLWQDRSGWHVKWSSGADSVSVNGTITTDGRVRGLLALDLESDDVAVISASGDSLDFAGSTHGGDAWDAIDFALADDTAISIAGGASALGTIADGGSAAGSLTLDVTPTARGGQIAVIDLELASSSGGPWSAEVPLVVVAPALEAIQSAVDDSGTPPTSGNGNGVAEPGETVRLTPTVLNRGDGVARAVTGTLAGGAGIALVDAADDYGDVASLAQVAGSDGYLFTIVDSTGTSVALTLADDVGRTWEKVVDFAAPDPPESLTTFSEPSRITVGWAPSGASDLAGYNVYRSVTSGTGFERRNFELLREASRWADEGLSIGSAFWYRVTAVDASGNESAPSAEVFAWTTAAQVDGWPQNAGGNVFSSPGIADADGEGGKEIFVGSQDFGFYGWSADGSPLNGFPLSANGQVWGTPALADIDSDGDREIFFGASDSRFYGVHHDGTPVWGTEPHLIDLVGTGALMRGAATVADVDGDQDPEILVGTDNGRVYAFHHDGTGLADSTGLLYSVPPYNSQARIWGPIAVADLDADLVPEIVFASWNDSLYVVDATGALEPGFPRGASRAKPGEPNGDFRTGPAIGDLDQDGTMEILVGSVNDDLLVFDHDGSGYLSPDGVFASFPDDLRGVPALANLDADPELEIVVGCIDGTLYVFNHDGTGFLNPGGELHATGEVGFQASPIVVDVDGDLEYEILVGSLNGNFYAFHVDGTIVAGFPIPTPATIYSTAAAADIDGDGDVDVAFASYDQTVNVMDLGGPSVPEAYEWPMYGANPSRTSTYGSAGYGATDVGGATLASLSLSLAQNAPNPFVHGTVIGYGVPGGGSVTLRVFDVSGRLVRTLVNGRVEPGAGTVYWDGRDGRGVRVSSGVYFYRLDDGRERVTRKGVRLR